MARWRRSEWGRRPHGSRARWARRVSVALAGLTLGVSGAGCAGLSGPPPVGPGQLAVVGAESQYADLLRQIGGRYVAVSSVLDNPNTDPHTFELSPQIAQEISRARLIVQNGAGYDVFMNTIETATASSRRRVIVAQRVLGEPVDLPNPHLWYDPATMPAVARRVAADLGALQPRHRAYFAANLARFDASLRPLRAAITAFRARHPGVTAATTEPVADDLLNALGIDNLTPFSFQADVMNGVDPSAQDITLEQRLLSDHRVRVLCENRQVVDALTTTVRQTAQRAGVPVVAVYETMPIPGYDYQTWMLAEVRAISRAVTAGTSTESL
jgi:zinc/manganese transport system substrate-binding protein